MLRTLSQLSDLNQLRLKQATLLILLVLSLSCHSGKGASAPSIEFTRVPQPSSGDSDKIDVIQGRVGGAQPGQQIVLYVRNGNWWVQPLSNLPFTKIQPDSSWINSIHVGPEYAALLVDQAYRPEAQIQSLPEPGNLILAVATSKDFPAALVVSPTLQFSGYEWRIRTAPSNRGDRMNPYSQSNAWTDAEGALHLRIAKESGRWTCAEVTLTRSLGYGEYSFAIRDTSKLGQNVAFSMFTWDYAGAEQNNREMSIEVGQVTDPPTKNAQYVVQPFYVAANVTRFTAPSGPVIHSFRWEPGKLSFRTVGGSIGKESATPLAEHIFNSGVPSPGVESVRIALYIFGQQHENPAQREAEVIIDKFHYLP